MVVNSVVWILVLKRISTHRTNFLFSYFAGTSGSSSTCPVIGFEETLQCGLCFYLSMQSRQVPVPAKGCFKDLVLVSQLGSQENSGFSHVQSGYNQDPELATTG
jgi:hypothetical protein